MQAAKLKLSIPFNYHLATDAPRFQEAVAALQSFLAPYLKGCDRRLARDNISILLLNFMRLLDQDAAQWVRYSRQPKFKQELAETLGNPWRASRKLWDIIAALKMEGLVEQTIGSHRLNNSNGLSEQTCIKPLDAFTLTYIIRFGLLGAHLRHHEDTPLIRYRLPKSDDLLTSRRYPPTRHQHAAKGAKAGRLAAVLQRYNALLEQTELAISDSEADTSDTFTYRVYSDKELTTGGRFYGGFWQQVKRASRTTICINGEATVELDFKACYPHLAYALYAQQAMADHLSKGVDAYTIPFADGTGYYPRPLGKKLFLIAFNCNGRKALAPALKEALASDRDKNKPTSKEHQEAVQCLKLLEGKDGYKKLYEAFTAFHKPIEPYLYKQCWKLLSYHEAAICTYVMDAVTGEGIPVLTIHDSFICQQSHKAKVEAAMREAFTAFGMPLALPLIEVK